MEKNNKTFIPGELISAAENKIVASSKSIYDYRYNKSQEDLNKEFKDLIEEGGSINPNILEGFENRLSNFQSSINNINQRIGELDYNNIRESISNFNDRLNTLEENPIDPQILNNINQRITTLEENQFDEEVIQEIREIIENIEDKSSFITNIEYANLKNLKDNNLLIPGQYYRIIDFVTTVNPALEEVRSANHQFDVIVKADSTSILDENAAAMWHSTSEEDYFHTNDLPGWKLKYTLDNSIVEWGDLENGKGVIYKMEDEFNNQFLYDFKNIQYKLYKVRDSHPNRVITSGQTTNYVLNGKYCGLKQVIQNEGEGMQLSILDEDDYIWCYTFSSDPTGQAIEGKNYKESQIDISLSSRRIIDNNFLLTELYLPYTVFFANNTDVAFNNMYVINSVFLGDTRFNHSACFNSVFGGRFVENFMVTSSSSFGDEIRNNYGYYANSSVGSSFYTNTMLLSSNNVFGNGCKCNVIQNIAYGIIGNNFQNNNCGTLVRSTTKINGETVTKRNIIIGNDCRYNIISYMYGTVVGNSFSSNNCLYLVEDIFENSIVRNHINDLRYSKIGSNASGNIFGFRVSNIELPEHVRYCEFESDISFIRIRKTYFYDSIIEKGNWYLTIDAPNNTTSETSPLRFIKVCSSVNPSNISYSRLSGDQEIGSEGPDEQYRKTINYDSTVSDHLVEYRSINSQTIFINNAYNQE